KSSEEEGSIDGIEIIMNGSKMLAEDDRASSTPTVAASDNCAVETNSTSINNERLQTRRRSSSLDNIEIVSLARNSQEGQHRFERIVSIHSVEIIDSSDDNDNKSGNNISKHNSSLGLHRLQHEMKLSQKILTLYPDEKTPNSLDSITNPSARSSSGSDASF
ncbi:hypothetical protein GJ496_001059, partial [Pomphorhynchus laevis]